MSTKHAITGGHVSGSEDGTHGRARRVAIVCACLVGAVLTVALLSAVARGAVASTTEPRPISYVCINKSNGQLFYLDPCKTKSQTKVEFSTSEPFKACYLLSSGVTRKVSDTTTCDNNPRKKEGEILHVPDDEDPLYFCVGSDGTMYFKPKSNPPSVPTCPAGQDLVVIGPHNQPPVATNDTHSVNEGDMLNVAAPGVLGNDTDPGDTLRAVLVSGPAHASSFSLNGDGSFTYVHDGSETTSDSFTYNVIDGSGAESNIATVSITIDPVNDAPVAVDDVSYNVSEGGTLNVAAPGVLGNDTDPDGPTFNAVLVSGPTNAESLTLNSDGSFIYVHNGSETTTDSFTYMVTDGTANSNVATVWIIISPVDDAPPLP